MLEVSQDHLLEMAEPGLDICSVLWRSGYCQAAQSADGGIGERHQTASRLLVEMGAEELAASLG